MDAAPTAEDPAECVTDKGYHSRSVLKALDERPLEDADLRAQAERRPRVLREWHGDGAGPCRAVTNNRTRLLNRAWLKASLQGCAPEIVEALLCATSLDRSAALRRTWLRGRENVHSSDTCSMSPATI